MKRWMILAAVTALLLGMTIRLAVFERQGLLRGEPEGVERRLEAAVAAVLET